MALATSVASVQKAIPAGPPIAGRTGNKRAAAAIASIAAASTQVTSFLTELFTGAGTKRVLATLARDYQPATPAPPARARAISEPTTETTAPQRANRVRIVVSAGLPALDEFLCHQKVPSSVCEINNRHTP